MKEHPFKNSREEIEEQLEDVEEASGASAEAEEAAPEAGDEQAAGDSSPTRPEPEQAEPGLEQRVEEATAEAAENYDRFLRARAELENARKRQDRELSERAKYAVEPLARDLLAVVDDLERALGFTDGPGGGLAEGVKLVHKSITDVLGRHGVTKIESVGAAFDPAVHEAVATVESAEAEPNTVIEEHRAGYLFKDRLLRAAMVVVSKAPAEKAG